jgi:hypothetical protein
MPGDSGKASVDVQGHGPVLVSRSPDGLVEDADGN